MRFILTETDPVATFEARGGGKALNLARMAELGIPVPPWFCVSAEAFDVFVERYDLKAKLDPRRHLDRLEDFAREVDALFLEHHLPDEVEREISAQLKTMGIDDRFLAIRSSGIGEDSAGYSFAGQFSSFLYQKGAGMISEAVRRCWASGFSARAMSYRAEQGLQVTGIRVGVVIQVMVDAAVAGVVFSRDPVHPLDRDHLVVDSVFGLGEGLVSGELDADHFEVNRATLEIDRRAIAEKTVFVVRKAEGGVVRKPLEAARRNEPSLSEQQVRDIASVALKLEKSLDAPQDCEWLLDSDGVLFVVQTRPITTLPGPAFFSATINGNEPTLWDNSNIVESYSGVTSPLTFSFASRAYRQVYVQFCEIMGVPKKLIEANESMFRNMLGLVRGNFYYNLINWYRLIQLLPLAGHSASFMETMMGVKQELKPELASMFEFVRHPVRYSMPRRVWVALMTAWRFFRIERIVREFFTRFDRIYDESRGRDFTVMSLPALATHYQYLEDRLLREWHAPIINDYLCMVFFGLLKKLTEAWIARGGEGAALQNDLLCGQGGLESTAPTKLLMGIAEWVDLQPDELKRWLDTTSGEEAWRQMKCEARYPELRELIENYLREYGFRCVNELKLEEKDLHEDPSFIINAITSYVRSGTYNIAAMEERERTIRIEAEAIVDRQLSMLKRPVYNWVLGQARGAVKRRENLRFARTKIFGIARHLFRAIGTQLVRLGLIEHERDVFYLTLEEILGFIEGRPMTVKLAELIVLRKQEFDEFRRTPPPPERFLTYGAVGVSTGQLQVLIDADLLSGQAPANDDPNVFHGTPCCPGIVEGIVRVAESCRDAEGMEQEILVTARTDPGWVPLYPSCAALLIERGSLLSHSAVVARELGLPTIVGVPGGLMKRLKTGQRVRIDAARGEIRILE